jgi:hypothetical protein
MAEDHENIQVQVLRIVNTKNKDQVGPEQCVPDVITAVPRSFCASYVEQGDVSSKACMLLPSILSSIVRYHPKTVANAVTFGSKYIHQLLLSR